MSKLSLIFIIMCCMITIGVLSFINKQHEGLEDEWRNINITLVNECSKIIEIYRGKR